MLQCTFKARQGGLARQDTARFTQSGSGARLPAWLPFRPQERPGETSASSDPHGASLLVGACTPSFYTVVKIQFWSKQLGSFPLVSPTQGRLQVNFPRICSQIALYCNYIILFKLASTMSN